MKYSHNKKRVNGTVMERDIVLKTFLFTYEYHSKYCKRCIKLEDYNYL